MRVLYSGIDLGVLETIFYAHDAVYDDTGTDYLYTRVAGRVKAQVNGQAQVMPFGPGNGPFASYAFDGSPGAVGVPTERPNPSLPRVGNPLGVQPAGTGTLYTPRGALRRVVRTPNAPPLTVGVVRQRLCTPRGKLWVFAGPGAEAGVAGANGDGQPGAVDQVMLESPAGDGVVDCKNGPFGKSLSVTAALGDANTLVVEFEFETFINESDVNGVAGASPLLSNRFSQTQMVDQAGYTTTFTGGVAVFRTDLLYRYAQSPDQSRPLLFMPVPAGCVRESVEVKGRADVTGVEYGYRDRQVPVNFPAGPYARAASISALHRQAISTGGDIFGGVLAAYERVAGVRANKHIAEAEQAAAQKAALTAAQKAARPATAIHGYSPQPPPG